MKAPEFTNRWLIKGTLCTQSELHIGDGNAASIADRTKLPKSEPDQPGQNEPLESETSDCSTVCVDYKGRAYIPGTAVRGAFRASVADQLATEEEALAAWWRDRNTPGRQRPATPLCELFGSSDADKPYALGGKLVFFDAFFDETDSADPKHANDDITHPWWDPIRRTAVTVSVSLDRRTKTARENLLYHLEYVPAKERFAVEIGGHDLSGPQVARLLGLLQQFNDGKLRLGAQQSNGWGKLGWTLGPVSCIEANNLAEWKSNPSTGFACCTAATPITPDPQTSGGQLLNFDIALEFTSPWLIRDAKQRERVEIHKRRNGAQADKPYDATPEVNEEGRAMARAKSIRGALRARCEMILRTLNLPCKDHPGDIDPIAAKNSEDAVAAAKQEIKTLDLAARLFGASGWRAPIRFSRFVSTTLEPKHTQEFVAIDRFLGSAAEGCKFNTEAANDKLVKGTLTIDLTRLKMVDPECASIGLLALALRDLAEGDIPIGAGSAKGFGACTATIKMNGEDFRAHEDIATWLAKFREPLNRGDNRENFER